MFGNIVVLYCRPVQRGIVTDSHFFWHKQGNKQSQKIATGSSNRAKRVPQASKIILLRSAQVKEFHSLQIEGEH